MSGFIETPEQLASFLHDAVLNKLSMEPLPATREGIAWAIGMAVKEYMTALRLNQYLPPTYRYKDITVDFDRNITYPKYRVTVSPL